METFNVYPSPSGDKELQDIGRNHHWRILVFDDPLELRAAVLAEGGVSLPNRPVARMNPQFVESQSGGRTTVGLHLGDLYMDTEAFTSFWVPRVSLTMAADTLRIQANCDGDPDPHTLILTGGGDEKRQNTLGIVTGQIANQLVDGCLALGLKFYSAKVLYRPVEIASIEEFAEN